jgi:hypothetical protein
MNPRRDLFWRYWLLTGLALGAGLAGMKAGLPLAMGLTAVQGVHLVVRKRSLVALAVQVRAAFLALLVLGSWPPLRALHWMQLTGVAARLLFDYCALSRILSLLPWNRRGPLTLARLRATFLTPPVRGNIAEALDGVMGR